MPDAGGPATFGGVAFQIQMAVLDLAHMLADEARNAEDPVTQVQVEAFAPINDIVVARRSGARVFRSCKEHIKRDSSAASPWFKLWADVGRQVNAKGFRPNVDRVQIVLGTPNDLSADLRDLLDTRLAPGESPELVAAAMSSSTNRLFESICTALGASTARSIEILRCVSIKVFAEGLYAEVEFFLQWSIVDAVNRRNAIAFLKDLVLHSAKRRCIVGLDDVKTRLANGGIEVSGRPRLFRIVAMTSERVENEDARRFFVGFPPTWPLIQARVPVARTLIKDTLPDILRTVTDAVGVRVVVLDGARAVGKTTLCMQLAHALTEAGEVVAWHEPPRRLTRDARSEYLGLLARHRRLHIFTDLRVRSSGSDPTIIWDRVLDEFSDFTDLIGRNAAPTIYLEIESNQYALIGADLRELCLSRGYSYTRLPVPLNLSGEEIAELASKLTFWQAAGCLAGRNEADLVRIFTSKSNGILLVALMETTLGRSEQERFTQILWREYQELPDELRRAYEAVAMAHCFGIPTPLSLIVPALAARHVGPRRPLSRSDLSQGLRDVVIGNQVDHLTTRHSLVAEKLRDALTENLGSASEAIWLEHMRGIVEAAKSSEESHAQYIEAFVSMRVPMLLTTALDELAKHVVRKSHGLLQSHRAAVLSTIARCFQARRDYAGALEWADKSWQIWPDHANSARIIMAYCYLSTRNEGEAANLAEESAAAAPSAWHFLQAIRLLCFAGQAIRARALLESAAPSIRNVRSFGKVKRQVELANLRADVPPTDPWSRADWIDRRLSRGNISGHQAIAELRSVLVEEPNVHSALALICHLLLAEGDVQRTLEICDLVHQTCEKRRERLHPITKVNPPQTKALAMATRSWVLFRRDGVSVTENTVKTLTVSLTLHPRNAWAKNWLGVVKDVQQPGSVDAQQCIREAIAIDPKPPFYANLAEILMKANVEPFLTARNDEIIELCKKGLRLCPEDSYWDQNGLRHQLLRISGIASDYAKRLKNGSVVFSEVISDADFG